MSSFKPWKQNNGRGVDESKDRVVTMGNDHSTEVESHIKEVAAGEEPTAYFYAHHRERGRLHRKGEISRH
ncbi:unnamed protein product [Heligmosomoides polygyrus]|uniref:DUF3606 domain-containing protein n=1 Tax=Heligmosomoides polygyrus TaxID=6339 RepID=A0A183FHU1_HELPZ|nr:unnamed protein product [Heligmosomoides polygyrus]